MRTHASTNHSYLHTSITSSSRMYSQTQLPSEFKDSELETDMRWVAALSKRNHPFFESTRWLNMKIWENWKYLWQHRHEIPEFQEGHQRHNINFDKDKHFHEEYRLNIRSSHMQTTSKSNTTTKSENSRRTANAHCLAHSCRRRHQASAARSLHDHSSRRNSAQSIRSAARRPKCGAAAAAATTVAKRTTPTPRHAKMQTLGAKQRRCTEVGKNEEQKCRRKKLKSQKDL